MGSVHLESVEWALVFIGRGEDFVEE